MLIILNALVMPQQLNNANDTLTQLGVGGIFALLIIREVLNFVKNKKVENAPNGYQKVATCNEIVKRFDKSFDQQDKRFDKVDDQLDEVKVLIKNGNK